MQSLTINYGQKDELHKQFEVITWKKKNKKISHWKSSNPKGMKLQNKIDLTPSLSLFLSLSLFQLE